MASQVLSGARNASYTNNTGQNVRLIINYMQNVTRMTWAGVTVNAESTTIGKDIQNITGEFKQLDVGDIEGYLSNITFGRGPSEINLSQTPGNPPNTLAIAKPKVSDEPIKVYYSPGRENTSNPSSMGLLKRNSPSTVNSFGPTASVSELGGNRYLYETTSLGEERTPNIFYVPQTISKGGNFPVELMLAPNQAFSAVCGAFNAIVIKEDGT